jgi:hypothetical protein
MFAMVFVFGSSRCHPELSFARLNGTMVADSQLSETKGAGSEWGPGLPALRTFSIDRTTTSR